MGSKTVLQMIPVINPYNTDHIAMKPEPSNGLSYYVWRVIEPEYFFAAVFINKNIQSNIGINGRFIVGEVPSGDNS